MWAAEPEDLSLLHLLFYVHSAGSLEMLFDAEGGAQQDRFVGGSQLVPLRMAGSSAPSAWCSAHPFARSTPREQRVTVRAGPATVVWAQRAVVAVSAHARRPHRLRSAAAGFRDQLTQRMPLGTVAKCMAVYDEPFWRAAGLSGQATSTVEPIKLTFDNSPPDGSPGVLLGFLEAAARELGRLPADQRRAVSLLSPVLRSPGRRARALHRVAVGRGGVVAWLLWLPHAARRLDELRPGAARADRPAALGERGDGHHLERLHGRRGALRRAGRSRSPRRL